MILFKLICSIRNNTLGQVSFLPSLFLSSSFLPPPSSLPPCPLLYLSFFALNRTSSTGYNFLLLSRSCKSRLPYLIPSLSGGNFQSFTVNYNVSSRFFIDFCHIEEVIFYAYFSESF